MPPRKRLNISPPEWESWSGSRAGKAMQFVEQYLILPNNRQKMVLHPYQRDLFESWSDPSAKLDITKIAAGNAKTTTLAAYCVAHLFMEEEAHVPVVAATVSQAQATTYGVAARFIELNPDLMGRADIKSGKGTAGIFVGRTNAKMDCFADRPDGLQGLQPSIAVLEETSQASMETFSALSNRMGKKPFSKLIGISTPSTVPDNALLTLERAVESGIEVPNLRWNAYQSDQKDHRDESQWSKANPALLTTPPVLDLEAIRTDLHTNPEQWFRAYRLCQWPVGGEACWLNSLSEEEGEDELGDAYEIWQRGASSWAFRKGSPMFVGVDFAISDDHAAVVYAQFRDDGRLHTKCRLFIPLPGKPIDPNEVGSFLHKLNQDYDVKGVFYDPSYFRNAPQLEEEGLPMVSVSPMASIMAPIVFQAYQEIRRQRVTHDADDAYTKSVMNGRKYYVAQGFTIQKQRGFHAHKIDAAVALCLAIHASLQPVKHEPYYKFGW